MVILHLTPITWDLPVPLRTLRTFPTPSSGHLSSSLTSLVPFGPTLLRVLPLSDRTLSGPAKTGWNFSPLRPGRPVLSPRRRPKVYLTICSSLVSYCHLLDGGWEEGHRPVPFTGPADACRHVQTVTSSLGYPTVPSLSSSTELHRPCPSPVRVRARLEPLLPRPVLHEYEVLPLRDRRQVEEPL